MCNPERKYHFQWWMKIFAVFLIPLAIFVLRISTGLHFWFFVISSPLLIVMSVGSLLVEYKINEEGSRAMIYPFISRQILWEDIETIYEDNFFSLRLCIFTIRRKGLRGTFGYNNACTYYEDFLREAVSRVRPDTKVEDKVLALIGFTKRDIGKNYKRNITG